MSRLPRIIRKALSVRLSLMVVSSMAALLIASLAVMFYFSRKTVKEEAIQKASQTLEFTVQHIDNILLSVEQTTGNIYFNLLPHLDEPDMIYTYCQELVKSNPCIQGCAIAFKPGFYKDRDLFMPYIRRAPSSQESDSLVCLEAYANSPYTEQMWYTIPMASGKPGWTNPLKDMDNSGVEPIITFSLPIPGTDGNPVAVIGVDVSLNLLSQIVLAAKPSANSYCTLLDGSGSYLVHPDSNKLYHRSVLPQLNDKDPTAKEAAQSMLAGDTRYMPFTMDGTDYYVFYKPFKRAPITGRAMEDLKWSAGIVYPEDDIFGDYNSLLYYVLAIAVAGLLLLFLLCRIFIHRQLKPLQMLTEKADHIANGHFDETIPESRHKDEIGRLQDNFRHLQQSLAANISELQHLTETMQQRGEGLRVALDQAQKAERMKTAFLHNMTNQMIEPSNAIVNDVNALCGPTTTPSTKGTVGLADDIQQNGNTIAELLNALINMSDDEIRKEADHD